MLSKPMLQLYLVFFISEEECVIAAFIHQIVIESIIFLLPAL